MYQLPESKIEHRYLMCNITHMSTHLLHDTSILWMPTKKILQWVLDTSSWAGDQSPAQRHQKKYIQIIATGLDCPSKSDGETLLLKTAHTCKHHQTTGHENVKLVLTGKLSSCWLAFTIPKGVFQAARGKSQQQSNSDMNSDQFGTMFPWIQQ